MLWLNYFFYQNGGGKASRTAAATKKGAPTSDPNAVNAGTVTLTQNQLNTILETIGRLTISNQELTESRKDRFIEFLTFFMNYQY